jgi:Raf kinase inhibitor-like YbhB/YbcL family protein
MTPRGHHHLGALRVTTPAFEHGTAIPVRYTAAGDDVSPPLQWTNIPAGTRQLALVCHDPDAPLTHGFTHWVLYGIHPDATGIPEDGGAEHRHGLNDFGTEGYRGPAPPPGHGIHHYYFHLYALDREIPAKSGLRREELLKQIDPFIIEQARVVGTFSR